MPKRTTPFPNVHSSQIVTAPPRNNTVRIAATQRRQRSPPPCPGARSHDASSHPNQHPYLILRMPVLRWQRRRRRPPERSSPLCTYTRWRRCLPSACRAPGNELCSDCAPDPDALPLAATAAASASASGFRTLSGSSYSARNDTSRPWIRSTFFSKLMYAWCAFSMPEKRRSSRRIILVGVLVVGLAGSGPRTTYPHTSDVAGLTSR